jgi:translation initiation factor IF-3
MGKDKVKVTIMFRGREVTHPERGVALLTKLAEELVDVGTVEQSPLQDGRNMTMMLGPSKAVLAGELDGDAAGGDAAAKADGAETKADAAPVEAEAKSEAVEVKADAAAAGSNGHHNGDVAKTPSPASSDATA